MFNRDDEKRVIQQINDYLKNSQILISLENKHQLQLMVELFDRHEMKYTLVGIDEVIYPGINLYVGKLASGLELIEEKVVILTAHELFGEINVSKTKYFRFKDAKTLRNFQELNVGDYVVHDSYGIGQYLGIKTLDVKGYHKDYLYVAYAGDDTLYIPVEQFKMIRKYASADGKVPMIHALGSSKWTKAKQKAKNKIDDIADRLIELYAKRMSSPGFAFSKDNELQIDFENQFGYALTTDQQRSVDEIKLDMEKPQPMDRLLCGDVGFGKTEVALRGAFKAILDHKQVAFLCPTTILSMQHFKTATERFKNFPVEIALLNRFTSSKEKERILKEVKEGKIDLLIGTHRILSKDVAFNDLGLLVIDEEQRFGVKQKEKIKEYRETIDVLSLSATPIPRTLQMSLMGIRGLSKIDTPPKNRLPVQTYVVEKNNTLIKQVIERELARDGQVFYLYNRTDQIANVAYKISSTVPNAKVAIGHGQMDKNELEDVMLRFMNKEFNVLICTTIIETGIDIPNANTMIVEDADKFGLAQLYQIRGRVGRSERGAYAYLLYKKDKSIQDDALKRLKAIKEFTELGSGYKIAMRDLSIRGSGDILGGKQAGFIDDIGFEMYMKILQDAINVRMHKDEKPEEEVKNLNVSVDGYIPDDYVESDYEKLELYQRLDKAKTMSELNSLKAEFDDYYGNLPEAILTLIEKRKLEILSHYSIIEDIKDSGKQLEIIFSPNAFETISGDKLFLLANQLFTKPAFKSLDNKITIKINKHDQWLNRLNEFIETLSKK
jgi:transcription-repair coupling factor (superfamily II helicase)